MIDNTLARIEIENLRQRQARLKELFQRGGATAAELRQVAAEIEKVRVRAAEETSAIIKRETMRRQEERNHPFRNSGTDLPGGKHYNYLGNDSPGKLYGGKE
jgi:hypothetical protein